VTLPTIDPEPTMVVDGGKRGGGGREGGYGGGDGDGGKRGGYGGGECRSKSTTASMSEEAAATYAYEPLRATLFTCEQHVRASE